MKNLIKLFASVDERRLNSVNSLQPTNEQYNHCVPNNEQSRVTSSTGSRSSTSPDSTGRSRANHNQYSSLLAKPSKHKNSTDILKRQDINNQIEFLDENELFVSKPRSSLTTRPSLHNRDCMNETREISRKTNDFVYKDGLNCDHSTTDNIELIANQKLTVTNHLDDQDGFETQVTCSTIKPHNRSQTDNETSSSSSWLNLGNYLPTLYHFNHNKGLINDKQLVGDSGDSFSQLVQNSQGAADYRGSGCETIDLVDEQHRERDQKECSRVKITRESDPTITTGENQPATTKTKTQLSGGDELDDWVLLNEDATFEIDQHHRRNRDSQKSKHNQSRTPSSPPISQANSRKPAHNKKRQMALNEADIELIRASWVPARKDTVNAGVLLFKGLFTKFPDYLKFFPNFSDLDIERMRENKRLLKHAVKVIDTVTFLVDSIGDESKSKELNDALVNLVRSHLRRKIGLTEFRNLGIVIIDFICELNINNNQYDSKIVEAWTKLYTIILDLVNREEKDLL